MSTPQALKYTNRAGCIAADNRSELIRLIFDGLAVSALGRKYFGSAFAQLAGISEASPRYPVLTVVEGSAAIARPFILNEGHRLHPSVKGRFLQTLANPVTGRRLPLSPQMLIFGSPVNDGKQTVPDVTVGLSKQPERE